MAKKKEWSEGELVAHFQLKKLIEPTPLMSEWLSVAAPTFSATEQEIFDDIYEDARYNISNWNEEDLKMKFISLVLRLGKLSGRNTKFVTFFERNLEAKIAGEHLSVRCDFVIAKGVLDYLEIPYFHFQEYKPNKKPSGDSMAQLLEAFLIAQSKNQTNQPLYGCEVVGKQWTFITMEEKEYCVSNSYDCTNKEEMLQIISVLRKFRDILDNRFLKNE